MKLSDAELEKKARLYEKENDDYHDTDGVDVRDVFKAGYRECEKDVEAKITSLELQLKEAREIFEHILTLEHLTPGGSTEGWVNAWLAKNPEVKNG